MSISCSCVFRLFIWLMTTSFPPNIAFLVYIVSCLQIACLYYLMPADCLSILSHAWRSPVYIISCLQITVAKRFALCWRVMCWNPRCDVRLTSAWPCQWSLGDHCLGSRVLAVRNSLGRQLAILLRGPTTYGEIEVQWNRPWNRHGIFNPLIIVSCLLYQLFIRL